MQQSDDRADVPSPIDLRDPIDASQWAETALAKRPWREAFLRAFVAELEGLRPVGGAILELGSGPGFLARRILESLPQVDYTALDFSSAMHALAQQRLGSLATRARFVVADFRSAGWTMGLSKYHAVVTLQAVHELRHKRRAVGLYQAVRHLLLPGGIFLVCDHVCGEGGMINRRSTCPRMSTRRRCAMRDSPRCMKSITKVAWSCTVRMDEPWSI
jgi:SAM-dependent methyltransferase